MFPANLRNPFRPENTPGYFGYISRLTITVLVRFKYSSSLTGEIEGFQ